MQQLFKKGKNQRPFASETVELELATQDTEAAELTDFEEAGENQMSKKTTSQEFEILPEDATVRNQWLSLTIHEGQVVALGVRA